MGFVKTSITIPAETFKQAKEMSENFSQTVTEALKDYLHKKKIQKAKGSFGSWSNRDKDSIDIVNEFRKDEGRNYANRNH